MKIKTGINSPQIKEFGGEIDVREVDIIELGLDRVDFLNKQNEEELLLKAAYFASSFGTEFTIHAPHIDSKIEGIKIDFSSNSEKNVTIMKRVIKIAPEIEAKYIVVHPGEIIHIIEMVGSEHLKVNLDIGHAFIASNAYGLPLENYFELGEYIYQMHLHDNFGILDSEAAMFGDRHLPLGLGKINFREVFENIQKIDVRNLVLELKNSTREETLKSLARIRKFTRGDSQRLVPVITFYPDQTTTYAYKEAGA